MALDGHDSPDHRVTNGRGAAKSALGSRNASQAKNLTAPERRKRISSLFRKVYVLLLLRNVAVTVSECFAIYDESVSAFFAGTTGLIIVGMIWLVQMIFAAFTSVSDRLGPGDSFNQHRLVSLVALECIVCAGAATNACHSYNMRLADIATANVALGAFQLGHILFFFNPWLDYNALYGLLYGAVCVTGCALGFNWRPSASADHDSSQLSWLATLAGASFGFVCCAWYSLETHAFGARKRSADFRAHVDCFFVILCFAYADVWNVLFKCTFTAAKSTGEATKTDHTEQLAG